MDQLADIKVSLPVNTLIICLMKIWHWQFPCSMKHYICVYIMQQMEI